MSVAITETRNLILGASNRASAIVRKFGRTYARSELDSLDITEDLGTSKQDVNINLATRPIA